MAVREEILAANERYASSFDRGGLSSPPARNFAVVTCMDARLDPIAFLGLEVGDAHVIRNAGGVVSDDALRSLVVSHWLLGTREALVIAHTKCGMTGFTNEELRDKLRREAGADASDVDFLPFADLEQSVRDGVKLIEDSPLLPDSFRASGFVYEVETGRLREVA
jgi:carbonic anhydrase